MRILLIVVGVFVLLVLGVVLIGTALPKRHIASRSASFKAAPEQIFALIAGPQNWRPDVRTSETIHDADGRG